MPEREPSPPADEPQHPEPTLRKRTRRRVRTQPPPGSDPSPLPEPPRHAQHENDERLRAEKPPHY